MSKKDRIAIVISLFLFMGLSTLMTDGWKFTEVLILMAPVYVYWGYRFIRGDISFMGAKD